MSYPARRPRGQTLAEAFAWFVPVPEGDCLLWPASTTTAGYGQFVYEKQHHYAHIVAYELANGPVPEGMEVDHIDCVAPACIRDDHLRAVTHKQNQENRHGASSHSKTGIRGVWWVEAQQTWRCQVVHDGKSYATHRKTIEAAEDWVRAKRAELFTHNVAGERVVA